MYNELEREKTEHARENLLKMQQKIRDDEDKMLNCDGDVRIFFVGSINGKLERGL
jgi:hypothetical protein